MKAAPRVRRAVQLSIVSTRNFEQKWWLIPRLFVRARVSGDLRGWLPYTRHAKVALSCLKSWTGAVPKWRWLGQARSADRSKAVRTRTCWVAMRTPSLDLRDWGDNVFDQASWNNSCPECGTKHSSSTALSRLPSLFDMRWLESQGWGPRRFYRQQR